MYPELLKWVTIYIIIYIVPTCNVPSADNMGNLGTKTAAFAAFSMHSRTMFHVKQFHRKAPMKKKTKPLRPRHRLVGGIFLLIALLLAGFFGYCFALSRVLRVERATVYLPDLPQSFDGMTVLFVSDLEISGLSSAGEAASLMRRLALLKPDVLILGGDYASGSLMDALNGTRDEAALSAARQRFFSALADFPAPMGKFAVAGEQDAGAAQMEKEMAAGEITLLNNTVGRVSLGGESISIAGLAPQGEGILDYSGLSRSFQKGDCVLAVAHNPAAISAVMTAEAGDSGVWCDLILSGHTHGGQMIVGKHSMLTLSPQETRYPAGWSKESGVFILVSQGVGCEIADLRLGTEAQVHLITLRRGLAL